MAMTFQRMEVETGSPDHDGILVFDGERLLAVLLQLSDMHEELSGAWFLEYGPACRKSKQPFATLDDALSWIAGDRAA